jgi:pilus assembly protein CpaD
MTICRPSRSSVACTASALAALTLLSACAEPTPTDYRQKYAVSAYPTTVVLGVHVAGTRVAFVDDEDTRFATTIAAYLDGGHGPLTISAPRGSGGTRLPANLAAVRTRLLAAGVPPADIQETVTEQGSPEVVTLSYQRYEAVLPTCGDWTSSPSYDPDNTVSSNFGCAVQRDIGLMAADPADLVRARPVGPSDGQAASRVIQKYRAGLPTAATPNPAQLTGNAENPSAQGQP